MLAIAVMAAVLGAAFLAVWARWKLPGSLAASAGWLVYAAYEGLMHARILCTGECNIRVDLLVFWPVLLFLAVAVPVRAFRSKRRSERGR